MLKAILFSIAFIIVFVSVAMYILSQSEDVAQDEGFLYSAIGCTSVYKKLEQNDKVEKILNLIHQFSENQGITKTKPGYLDRFIKLVEKKWEKDHETAERNCKGIYKMAQEQPKPPKYNDVAQSVVDYIAELESKKHISATEKAQRLIKERQLEQQQQ